MAFSMKFEIECFLHVFPKNLQSENKWSVETKDSSFMKLGFFMLFDSKISLKKV